jgi:hypothetical protein
MPDLILWMKVGLAGRVVRVSEPLTSWRRHEGGLSKQTGFGRLREFLEMVEMGDALLRLSADAHAVRAEAFRNACLQAAFFTGWTGPSPGERFAAIDLGRPGTSALSSGLGPTDQPDERADEAAGIWRELARLTLELRRARLPERYGGQGETPGAGLRAARELLRRAGALPGDDADGAEISPARDIRMTLMEAAQACETDLDPSESRFLLIERGTEAISHEEFEELNALGFGAPPERLRLALQDRRRKVEELILGSR